LNQEKEKYIQKRYSKILSPSHKNYSSVKQKSKSFEVDRRHWIFEEGKTSPGLKKYVREAQTDKWKPIQKINYKNNNINHKNNIENKFTTQKALNTIQTNIKEIDKEIYFTLNDGRHL